MNIVLWNNEMTLSVGLKSEMDEGIFVKAALSLHLELSGVELTTDEYQVKKDENIYIMQVS